MSLTQIRKEQIKDLTIDNSKISESAAIAYSKLNLSSSIVASDLNTSSNTVHQAVLDSKLIALWDMVKETTVSGTSTDVTAKINSTAHTQHATDGSTQEKGVLLSGTGPGGSGIANYKVQIRNFNTGDPVSDNLYGDGNGGSVYGELRYDGSNYNLYYFKSDGTAYSFSDAVQISEITTVSDVSNSLDEKYFTIDTPTTSYYVWYNTSGVAGSGDPAVSGKTGVEVQINTNESAGSIAKKTAIALNAISNAFAATITDGLAEVYTIQAKPNTASSLNGKYFRLNATSASGSAESYVFWFSTSGVGIAPAVSGSKVQIDLSSADLTAAAVASTVQASINAVSGNPFSASANGDVITVTLASSGVVANADSGTSEFFFEQLVEGRDPSPIVRVINKAAGYAPDPANGAASPSFSFLVVAGGVSNIDFMFVEIYSYFSAPLMSFVTGMGFADVVGVSGTHNHNDLYYTRTELNSGALDNRYYTETELNGGQLDIRYFTKNDLSVSGAISQNVLDARYFTESEIASTANGAAGASLIGVTPTGSLAASNVQNALVEIQTDVDNILNGNADIAFSMDDAYNDGSAVTVDATNVEWNLSSGKNFKIADSSDANKFVVTAGNDDTSVEIDTQGGVDINVDSKFAVTHSTGGKILIDTGAGSKVLVDSESKDLSLKSAGALTVEETGTGKIAITNDAGLDVDSIKLTSTLGGEQHWAKKGIQFTSDAGDITFNDQRITSNLPLSQSGVTGLSARFDTASSIVGAINENAEDLYTLINSTLPATSDGTAGADKIGATGITGVIPTGHALGDAATVQEMLEGIAMGAGGGKTFADVASFTAAKASGTYFKANEPIFILDSNRWVIVKTQSVNVAEGVDWDYVAGTARQVAGATYQYNLTGTAADSFKVATTGGVDIDANNGISLSEDSGASINITSAGEIDLTSEPTQDLHLASSKRVFIEGVGGTSIAKISAATVDIDGQTSITAPAGQNVTVDTTGTGEVDITSSQKFSVVGGDINLAAGTGKSASVSSDTSIALTSATLIQATGGQINLNAGAGKPVNVTSDTLVNIAGGAELTESATSVSITASQGLTESGNKVSFTSASADADSFKVASTGGVDIDSKTGTSIADDSGAYLVLGDDGTTTVAAASGKPVNISSDTKIGVNGGALVDINASDVTIEGALTATAGDNKNITLTTTGSGGVTLNSAFSTQINAPLTDISGNVTIAASKQLNVDKINITSVDPLDQATISGQRTGQVSAANKLTNTGFELGTGTTASNWTLDASTTRVSDNHYYNDYSLHSFIENTGGPVTLFSQALTGLTPSTAYTVSIYAKGTSVSAAINAGFAGKTMVSLIPSGTNTAGWTRYTAQLPAENTAAETFEVAFGGDGNDSIDMYFDAVMLEEGTSATSYFDVANYLSELIFTIGNNTDDRLTFRSHGGGTDHDLMRINQTTVEVMGDLLVTGTTTQVNSTTVNIEDNVLNLNSNVTGAPSLDASLNVVRGTSPTVMVRWNETTDKWELTNDGSNFGSIVTTSGSSGLSLDTAYDGGSTINVDNTNVEWNLASSKLFNIYDAANANKFVVKEGSSADSIKIDTTGGVDIDTQAGMSVGGEFNVAFGTNGSLDLNAAADSLIQAPTGQGLQLQTNDNNLYLYADGASSAINIMTSGTGDQSLKFRTYGGSVLVSKFFTADATYSSRINVTGADLTIGTLDSGDLILSSAGKIVESGTEADITAAVIKTTGTLTQTGNAQIIGNLDLDGNYDQIGNYTFKVDSAATGADSVRVNTAGGIDIDAATNVTLGATEIQTTGALKHVGTSLFTGNEQIVGDLDVDGSTVSLTSTGTAGTHLTLVSADKASISSVGLDIGSGAGAITATAGAASSISATGGLTLKSVTSGDVGIESAAALTFKDAIATTAVPFSQTNASGLSAKFAYNSQTPFNWTSRSTGQDNITSVLGALNANRQDLWEFVELLNTEGAPIGTAAGANLIGCDGIASIVPNRVGAVLGDNGTVQEMLEALAITGGGSCKHFATLQDFKDYKAGTGSYTEAGYFNAGTQCYIVDIEREVRILQTGTGVIEGTDWDYLWGSARPLAGDNFKVTANSVAFDTVGALSVLTDAGFSFNDDSGASIVTSSLGVITINSAATKDITLTSDTKIALNGGSLVDVNGTSITLDGALTATGATNDTMSITSSGTGKSLISSANEVAINGGKISLTGGANGDVVLTTVAGSGKISLNGANAVEIVGGSASKFQTAGDLSLISTTGEIYFDDSRTAAIPLSDSTHTDFSGMDQGGGVPASIIGAIQRAYDHVGDTTFIDYQEHTADSSDVTNDYIVSNISLLPTSGTFPMSPSALRNITGNKVYVSIYLNGLRLTDSEWNYSYNGGERRITFDGTDNITLVNGDKIAIEITKVVSYV